MPGSLGYVGPNAAARALRQGHANAYRVVFADAFTDAFADPYTVEWLTGLAEAMQAKHRRHRHDQGAPR